MRGVGFPVIWKKSGWKKAGDRYETWFKKYLIMKPTKYDLKAKETLHLLNTVIAGAEGPVALILRHSARHYPERPEQEAFMTLTEEGKEFACSFGRELAKEMKPRLFSSCVTRCMETAYLIGKGYAMAHAVFPGHPVVQREMAPFYMNDIPAAVTRQRKVGHDVYLRMWLNRELPVSEIEDPKVSAEVIRQFLEKLLDQLQPEEIGLGVSHDWNLFPMKEYLLHQYHEQVGQVGYLEAVVLFREKGVLFLQGIAGEKVALI